MRVGIFPRLMAGYIALLVLSTGVSVYAIMQFGKVNNFAQSILFVDNPLIDLHKDLTDALLSETRYEKKFLILRDEALYDRFLASGNDFERILRGANLVAASDPVRVLLVDIRALHDRYKALMQDEVGKMKSGMRYPREQYAEEKEQVVNAILDKLSTMRLLSQQSIFHKVTDLRKSGEQARRAAMVITSVSLLFGIVLSFVITRSITKPLGEMKKKTEEIAEGVFKSDLDLASPPEIRELARAFNSMSIKLKEVDRMKSDFYALMSHELRTPLASIQEGTNLLLEGLGGEIAERQRRLLTIIAEESKRLIEQVSSLLDLSKLEAGMLAYNFSRAELRPLIAKAVEEVAPLAEAKKISIEQAVCELPPVLMDGERILQVLRNLIGNALKFTPPGGVVCISAHLNDGGVSVSVADTGFGIPKPHLTEIFDKYRQAAHKGSGPLRGTGLGLAIVKHIIQAHGGKVWAESEPGGGSIFTFILPD
ncbi:MAG TPA: HAMP domain-containing sensor histidine kinase [Nitrospirota bacterium]|nr:HAMP domain-containing sensor histidine kinase [Nitrospirota bacterium]